jgi:hypothetical protein
MCTQVLVEKVEGKRSLEIPRLKWFVKKLGEVG